jgi:hypothetical protein
MIKIAITSPDIREMKGIGKTSGKPYHMRIQTAHAFTVSADGVVAEFPDKFEIALDENQQPYPRGTYQLAPSAVQVSRDGRLECRPRLVAVASKAA